MGTNIVNLWGGNQANPGVFLPGPGVSTVGNVNNRRVLNLQNPAEGGFYGSISQLDDGGNLSYNGLGFSIQRRAAKGLTALANYTWSHCISDLHNPELAVAGGNLMIPHNHRAGPPDCARGGHRPSFNFSPV